MRMIHSHRPLLEAVSLYYRHSLGDKRLTAHARRNDMLHALQHVTSDPQHGCLAAYVRGWRRTHARSSPEPQSASSPFWATYDTVDYSVIGGGRSGIDTDHCVTDLFHTSSRSTELCNWIAERCNDLRYALVPDSWYRLATEWKVSLPDLYEIARHVGVTGDGIDYRLAQARSRNVWSQSHLDVWSQYLKVGARIGMHHRQWADDDLNVGAILLLRYGTVTAYEPTSLIQSGFGTRVHVRIDNDGMSHHDNDGIQNRMVSFTYYPLGSEWSLEVDENDESKGCSPHRCSPHRCSQLFGDVVKFGSDVSIALPPLLMRNLVLSLASHVGRPVGDGETHSSNGAYGIGPYMSCVRAGSHIHTVGRVAHHGLVRRKRSAEEPYWEEGDHYPAIAIRTMTGDSHFYRVPREYLDSAGMKPGASSIGRLYLALDRIGYTLSLPPTDAARAETMRDELSYHAVGSVPGLLALVTSYLFF